MLHQIIYRDVNKIFHQHAAANNIKVTLSLHLCLIICQSMIQENSKGAARNQNQKCSVPAYLNEADSAVAKVCNPFTMNHVTALWHCSVCSRLTVVFFSLFFRRYSEWTFNALSLGEGMFSSKNVWYVTLMSFIQIHVTCLLMCLCITLLTFAGVGLQARYVVAVRRIFFQPLFKDATVPHIYSVS